MPTVTIRNRPEATHRALKERAAQNGLSTEAELRAIVEAAARPPDRVRIGTAPSNLGRSLGLTDADVEALEQAREKTPAEPVIFG